MEPCWVSYSRVDTFRVSRLSSHLSYIHGFPYTLCRLNFPGTHPTHSAASPYLAAPSNPTDLEQRRRAWWMCLAFDRIVSVGGWPHSIDERDIGTELPLKREDFEAEVRNPIYYVILDSFKALHHRTQFLRTRRTWRRKTC